jgi:uncharacterized protein YkwD
MKASRFIIFLALVTALGIIIAQPQTTQFLNRVLALVGSEKVLSSLEDSALFPPPLRSAIHARNALLTESGTFEWTNFERKQNGLEPLKSNELLRQAAQKKMKDMFDKQYFEHVSPSGIGPADLAKSVGYAYVVVGENLALGSFESDKLLVEAWMNSPGHRANILNTRYQEIGIAVGKGMFEGREQWLAVQSFGLPLSACPSIDANLKRQLDENQAEIATLQAQLTVMKADIENDNRKDTKAYNAKVDRYNTLVGRLNSLIDQTKNLVAEYNAQVNYFNACLKE